MIFVFLILHFAPSNSCPFENCKYLLLLSINARFLEFYSVWFLHVRKVQSFEATGWYWCRHQLWSLEVSLGGVASLQSPFALDVFFEIQYILAYTYTYSWLLITYTSLVRSATLRYRVTWQVLPVIKMFNVSVSKHRSCSKRLAERNRRIQMAPPGSWEIKASMEQVINNQILLVCILKLDNLIHDT